MNIQQQAKIYIDNLASRKRNPIKPSTVSAYNCYLNKWIIPKIGGIDLSQFENGQMKNFIAQLDDRGLSPATIAGIENCVKGIVSSAVDRNGNELYPRKWNAEFIDAPPIDANDQKAPIIQPQVLQDAISRSDSQFGTLLTLLAGSGCRISEVLALKQGPGDVSSIWLPDESKLIIRKGLYRGKEQSTKTSAGQREVDICNVLNGLLGKLNRKEGELLFQSGWQTSVRPMTAYSKLTKVDPDGNIIYQVPGFHSLRRFRLTYLENAGVPLALRKYWAGHATVDISERYVKTKEDLKLRKEWCERVGLGFNVEISPYSVSLKP